MCLLSQLFWRDQFSVWLDTFDIIEHSVVEAEGCSYVATQQASHPLHKGTGRHECFLFTVSMLRDTQSIVWVRILEAVMGIIQLNRAQCVAQNTMWVWILEAVME